MTFDEILPAVRQGRRARRLLWGARHPHYKPVMTLELVYPQDLGGRPVMPQLLIESEDGVLRPFAGANWDLLADDWELCQ